MTHVDARGKRCPLPIIMIAKAVSTSQSGEVLTLSSDDPATWPDLQAWGRLTGKVVKRLEATRFEVTA
jgi:tRNA 2-thiouridine synthesizing protein A